MLSQKWEYCTVEWIWNQKSVRCNFPDGDELTQSGSYGEVVDFLTSLGGEGWEVATCAAGGNWLFWTLKRPTL